MQPIPLGHYRTVVPTPFETIDWDALDRCVDSSSTHEDVREELRALLANLKREHNEPVALPAHVAVPWFNQMAYRDCQPRLIKLRKTRQVVLGVMIDNKNPSSHTDRCLKFFKPTND